MIALSIVGGTFLFFVFILIICVITDDYEPYPGLSYMDYPPSFGSYERGYKDGIRVGMGCDYGYKYETFSQAIARQEM